MFISDLRTAVGCTQMEWVDLGVSSDSIKPEIEGVLAQSADDAPAAQTAVARPGTRAAELLALAERTARWEDDVTVAELQLYESLYREVVRQAQLELHWIAHTDTPALQLSKASIDRDRTALLELRAEACALVRRAEQLRRGHRPLLPKRWPHFALAIFSFAVGGLLASRDSLAETFDWGNVSRGRPWLASSRNASDVSVSGVLDDFSAPFFFHTEYQDNPWLEVDLGTETAARSITIVNREDCCRVRAAPLVVETSNDHRAWRIAATQRRIFSRWRARLDASPVRWIRLRVLRKSNLHLKAVVVRK